MIKAGADAVKVGIGPGFDLHHARHFRRGRAADHGDHAKRPKRPRKPGRPIIADGGIRYSGDMTKAIAAGAHAVMIGGLFAGVAESPGQQILYQGRTFKVYRGMGSLGAMVQGVERTLSPRRQRRATRQAGPRRGRRARALQGTAQHVHLSARRGICGPEWAIAAQRTLSNCATKPDSFRSPPRAYGRVIRMTSPLRKKHPITAVCHTANKIKRQRQRCLLIAGGASHLP